MEDLHECSSSSFKRLHDGLSLKAFKTSEGFISLKAGIAMLGLDSGALPLGIDELLQRTEALLPDAYASGRIATCRLPALLDFSLSSAIRSSHHDLAYPRRR